MKIMMNDNDNDNNEEKDEDDAEDYEENGCDNVCLRGMRRILYLPAQPCPHSCPACIACRHVSSHSRRHCARRGASGVGLQQGSPPKAVGQGKFIHVFTHVFTCMHSCFHLSISCIMVSDLMYPLHEWGAHRMSMAAKDGKPRL